MTAAPIRLTMQRISKSFPGVQALREVDFEANGGEIHALLGANGAGKSTLMKILSGAYSADEGTITIDGAAAVIRHPTDAKRHGIQCVYQEVDTALVPQLTVGENIMLDRLAGDEGQRWIRWGALYRTVENLLDDIGFSLPVRKYAAELTLAEKQLVLIARAVMQKAKFVIFDEPTAPLSAEEADRLFAVMRKLKTEGVGSIFISHRLPEVFQICDRITVMRDGRRVLTKRTEETDIPEIIEAMLGRTFSEEFPKEDVPIGGPLLEVKGVRLGRKVRGVDFTVRAGEIVGIAGLVGAGKTELSRLLFGADPLEGGEIRLSGRALKLRQPDDAIRAGIVLVPEERRKEGILVNESVSLNLTLPTLKRFSRWGFVRSSAEADHAEQLVRKLGIKTPDVGQQVRYLSGGNQQKVAVGKWLPTEARVFLFDEPTKGVDIGAKSDIFRLIGGLAREGKGIVYFSSEIAEILGIADRVLVMCDGRIVKEFNRGEATQDEIMYYASAGKERQL